MACTNGPTRPRRKGNLYFVYSDNQGALAASTNIAPIDIGLLVRQGIPSNSMITRIALQLTFTVTGAPLEGFFTGGEAIWKSVDNIVDTYSISRGQLNTDLVNGQAGYCTGTAGLITIPTALHGDLTLPNLFRPGYRNFAATTLVESIDLWSAGPFNSFLSPADTQGMTLNLKSGGLNMQFDDATPIPVVISAFKIYIEAVDYEDGLVALPMHYFSITIPGAQYTTYSASNGLVYAIGVDAYTGTYAWATNRIFWSPLDGVGNVTFLPSNNTYGFDRERAVALLTEVTGDGRDSDSLLAGYSIFDLPTVPIFVTNRVEVGSDDPFLPLDAAQGIALKSETSTNVAAAMAYLEKRPDLPFNAIAPIDIGKGRKLTGPYTVNPRVLV